MPLSMVDAGGTYIIRKVTGHSDARGFLEGLGFVPGSEVAVVSSNAAGLIVKVRESRVAIGHDMARRVMV